jgi:YbbR domain-containing protein
VIETIRRLPGALWFLGYGFVRSVLGNITLAVIAVALAASLWLYVTDRQNPKEIQAFNSAIPLKFVNVPTDLAVASSSVANVRIRIEASKSQLSGLRAEQFDATVNLGGYDKGRVTVTVEVSPANGNISVVEITPSSIDVVLESLRTKDVPVKVAPVGNPRQGFAAVNQSSDPDSVTVTGPESLVALVDSVSAEVYLTDQRTNLSEDRVTLKPQDARGSEISHVTANPSTAHVSIDIEQREFSQDFAVSAAISGSPASGYNVGAITVEPRIVSVTGALDVLQSIDAVRGISTEELSIADARADVVRQVQLTLPEGARLQGASTVRVTVAIRPARGEMTFLVVPQVRDIGDGLALTPPGAVLVTLAGDIPLLQSITPESIVVVADAQGLAVGLHAVPLQITAPSGTTVSGSDPAQLGIALVQRQ